MTSRRAFTLALGAALCLAAPLGAQGTATETLEIAGGFARASPKVASAGAGFMTIRSLGPADRLIGFRSPICEGPELHTHVNENGMMRMREVEAIEIPANGEAVLEPGGLHLMFIDLASQLVEGETVEVTLQFEQAGEVTLAIPVKGPGAMQ